MNNYIFRYSCDVCGQKPILRDLDMCAVCTFQEKCMGEPYKMRQVDFVRIVMLMIFVAILAISAYGLLMFFYRLS